MEKVTDVVEEDGGCEDVLGVLGGDWVVAGDCSETVWINLVEEVELSLLRERALGPCEAGFTLVGVGGACRCC